MRNENVRKPVEAVIIIPKDRKITLLSRRLFNVLLRHAQLNPVPSGTYHRIPLGKLMQDAKYDSRNLEHLVNSINPLIGLVVNWGDSPKNLNGPKYAWAGAALLAFASIVKEEGKSPELLYDFHKEISSQLLNPRVYATISMEMNATMSTHASLALYELAVRYLTNKNGLSVKLPWREWVTPLTGNPDISPTLQYKYFARDVLKPAINEVNSSQDDFFVEQLVGMVGRRVDTLQFRIQKKTSALTAEGDRGPAKAPLAEIEVGNLTLIGRMIECRIPQRTAEQLYHQHGPDVLRVALQALEARLDNSKLDKVDNPTAYLRRCLADPELVGKSVPSVVDIEAKTVPNAEPAIQALKFRYVSAKKAQMRQLFYEQSEADRLAKYKQFEAEVLPELNLPIKQAWAKFKEKDYQGNMHPFFEVEFVKWLSMAYLTPTDEELVGWAAEEGLLDLSKA